MNATCRYCEKSTYFDPSKGNTIANPRWKEGEWAHVVCFQESMDWSTKILVAMMMEIRNKLMQRAKR